MNNKVISVNTNIEQLNGLLEAANKKAAELNVLIQQINDFELETEFISNH
ncbi:hypothetical protein ABPS01_00855 [Streptococcus sp. ZJ151]